MSSMLTLPNELILIISEALTTNRDLNMFCQSCSKVTGAANGILYKRNANRSLLWGAERGYLNTVTNALCEGAEVNVL